MSTNLKTLLSIPLAVILLSTLFLAGLTVSTEWAGVLRGRDAVRAMERVRIVAISEERLPRERILTNGALGAPAAIFPVNGAEDVRMDASRIAPGAQRDKVDRLLDQDLAARSFPALSDAARAAVQLTDLPEPALERVGADVISVNAWFSPHRPIASGRHFRNCNRPGRSAIARWIKCFPAARPRAPMVPTPSHRGSSFWARRRKRLP